MSKRTRSDDLDELERMARRIAALEAERDRARRDAAEAREDAQEAYELREKLFMEESECERLRMELLATKPLFSRRQLLQRDDEARTLLEDAIVIAMCETDYEETCAPFVEKARDWLSRAPAQTAEHSDCQDPSLCRAIERAESAEATLAAVRKLAGDLSKLHLMNSQDAGPVYCASAVDDIAQELRDLLRAGGGQ